MKKLLKNWKTWLILFSLLSIMYFVIIFAPWWNYWLIRICYLLIFISFVWFVTTWTWKNWTKKILSLIICSFFIRLIFYCIGKWIYSKDDLTIQMFNIHKIALYLNMFFHSIFGWSLVTYILLLIKNKSTLNDKETINIKLKDWETWASAFIVSLAAYIICAYDYNTSHSWKIIAIAVIIITFVIGFLITWTRKNWKKSLILFMISSLCLWLICYIIAKVLTAKWRLTLWTRSFVDICKSLYILMFFIFIILLITYLLLLIRKDSKNSTKHHYK